MGIAIDVEVFELFHGRKMSPQEIGCATSHNLARSLIAKSISGGVILEDDARIIDLDSFYNLSTKFLQESAGTLSVLSLTGFRELTALNSNGILTKSRNIVHLLGKPDLAVAYVLTPVAGGELTNANIPISTVSDWPESECHYFALLSPVVKHGDSSTASIIVIGKNDFRIGSNFSHKLKFMLSPRYIVFGATKLGLRCYIKKIYLSRIFWTIDKYRFKLRILYNWIVLK
jgi:hypothetical protein